MFLKELEGIKQDKNYFGEVETPIKSRMMQKYCDLFLRRDIKCQQQ